MASMEAQSESSASRNSALRSSKLRFPLRANGSAKEASASSAQKRVTKPSADVTKSISVLDLSAKEKTSSAKPPRRVSVSVPTKPKPSPTSTQVSTKPNVATGLKVKTPVSSRPSLPKSDTPLSNMSVRRKFSVLSSVSYWVTQIKLAESASKHNISLGFFKLAFESGCEPIDRMKEELKTYIINHNLITEMSNLTTELLNLYNITEDLEQLKISVPKKSDSPKSIKSDKNSKNTPVTSSVIKRTGNLKPRSLNTVVNTGPKIRASNNKSIAVKGAVEKAKNPKKIKKIKKEDNEEKENENSSENILAEESGSTEDIGSKQEVSDKEENENMDNTASLEDSSEGEEMENAVNIPMPESSVIALEA